MAKNIIITAKSYYSHTKNPATKGQYPSNKYELGVTAWDDIDERLTPYVKEKDGVKFIKVANSVYPFRMYDKDMNKLDKTVGITNDTNIRVAFSIHSSEKWGKDYLQVEGVQVLDDIVEYNPFED